MLVDSKGNKVVVSEKLNSRTHPQVFSRLREVKEPVVSKAFKLGDIARFKQ